MNSNVNINMIKLFQNFLCYLLVGSSLPIFANIEIAQKHQIDSLKKLISINELSEYKVDLLNNLAVYQIVSAKYDSAKVTLDNSIFLSKELGYKIGEGVAYCNLGRLIAMRGDRFKAINFIDTSIQIHQDVGDQIGKANSLTQKGINFSFLQKKEEAILCLSQALKIQQGLGNKNGIADIYGAYGLVYDDGINSAKSLDYYFKCIDIKESLQLNFEQEIHLIYAYANLGFYYWNQQKFDKSIKYSELAISKMTEIGDKANLSTVNMLIAASYLEKQEYDKSKIYALRGLEFGKQANYDYSIGYACYILAQLHIVAYKETTGENNIAYLDSAKHLYRQQELICEKLSNKDGLIRVFQGFAKIHFLKDEFLKAIAFYERSDSIAKRISSLQLRLRAHKSISEAYSKMNNFEKAYIYYKSYDSINDIIESQEKIKAIQEIESENELKQIKQKELQEQEALNSRNFLQYSAIFAFLIFLLLFFNLSGMFNVPVLISKVGIFVTLIICFEFILVYLDPFVDSYTGGSPLFKLLINVFVAAFIYPLQNILEHRMKAK